MRLRERIKRLIGLKSDDGFVPRDASYDRGPLPRTLYRYDLDSQQGLDSNVTMAPVMWIMRTFTEAQAVVEARYTTEAGQFRWKQSPDHPVERLIDRPNDFYDSDALWKATVISYVLDGNSYWLKVRNIFGDVLGLWYVPHWIMRPRWPDDGSTFITHYEYSPGGRQLNLPPRDVVHFRFGLDPRNTRLGFSPLRPLLREIFTDDEAANFSATILRNMGVPGIVISPKDLASAANPDDVKKTKQYVDESFRGDRRGEPLVLGAPTEVKQFGFDPNQLMLANLRDIAEERVCAALGLPAAVVGFGAGLQSTKVGATMRELRRLAWVQCLIPMQKSLAKQLSGQLLPDFVSQLRRFRVRFDTSDVSAFQEEDDLLAARAAKLVAAGVLRVDRAQELAGLEVDETQRVYLRPTSAAPEGPDAPEKPEPQQPVDALPGDDELPAAIAARLAGNRNGGDGT